MTRFLQDILRQPGELQRALDHLQDSAQSAVGDAVTLMREASEVYLTGIGASWNAALAAGMYSFAEGRPVYMLDASEMLAAKIHRGAVMMLLSRSGDSAEIVALLDKAARVGATVIGITNFANGLLARKADIAIIVPVTADHGISVSTYSTLAMAATLIAHGVTHDLSPDLFAELKKSMDGLSEAMSGWQRQLAETTWLSPATPCYFLARGSSLASAYGARLLWEEGAKISATAMGIDSFRHGPQEAIHKGSRVAIWIGAETREQDLVLVRDLRSIGALVMVIGQNLSKDAADLVFELPTIPAQWQFLIDLVPAQLVAERLAVISGVDCDAFRFASYIVRNSEGLALPEAADSRES